MRIGIFGQKESISKRCESIVIQLIESMYLDIEVMRYDNRQKLLTQLGKQPIDIMLIDTGDDESFKELAKEIKYIMPGCALILVGTDLRHAIFGYTVQAVDFLMEDFQEEELIQTMMYVFSKRLKDVNTVSVKINGIWANMSLDYVSYIATEGHNLIFVMHDGSEFKMCAPLREYMPLLELNPNFLRCHKSYVVNLKYVKAFETAQLTLENDALINISRPYRKMTRQIYTLYKTQQYE